MTVLQESQVLESRGIICSKEKLSLVEENQVRECLSKLNVRKSMAMMGCTCEAAERFSCEAILNNLLSVMAIGRSTQRLEESRCSFLQEGGPRELQAS